MTLNANMGIFMQVIWIVVGGWTTIIIIMPCKQGVAIVIFASQQVCAGKYQFPFHSSHFPFSRQGLVDMYFWRGISSQLTFSSQKQRHQVFGPRNAPRSRHLLFVFPLCAGCLYKCLWIMPVSINLCNPEKKTQYCQLHACSCIIINHLLLLLSEKQFLWSYSWLLCVRQRINTNER